MVGTVIPSTRRWRGVAINTLVSLAATGLIFTSLELFLLLYDSADHQVPVKIDNIEKLSADTLEPGEAWREPDINPEVRDKPLTLPENWRQRRVEIPGAETAYYWHDVLHGRV